MEALAVFLETECLPTLAAPRRPSLAMLEGSGITLLVHLTVEMHTSLGNHHTIAKEILLK